MSSSFILRYSLGNVVVAPASLNTQTSLSLPGNNYVQYGAPIDQNMLSMLENFANNQPPVYAIPGQLWFDTSVKQLKLNTSGNSVAVWTSVDSNGAPGGPNSSVQFNNNGSLAGSSALIFDNSTNQLVSTGNIQAQIFIGDGSQLTGLPASYSNANVANYLPTYTGSLPLLTGNVVTTGNIIAGFFIGDGGLLSNISAGSDYSNANVTAFLPTYTGALPSLTGNVTTTANMQAGFFIGDGGLLSNIAVGTNYSNADVANYLPTYAGNLQANNILVLSNLTIDGDIIHEGDSFNDGSLVVSGNITSNANVITDDIYSRTGDIHIRAIGTNNNIYLWPTGPGGIVDIGNTLIANMSLLPLQADEATSKHYVDLLAQGIRPKIPAECCANETLESITGGTATYNNGVLGVGATLTMSNPLTIIDGYTIQEGDRILINGQANEAFNGVYTWTSPGLVITRSVDADQDAPETEWPEGTFLFIDNGTQYANTGWVLVTEVLIIGTSPIKFHQVSQAGEYSAGTGLDLAGTEFSIAPTGVTAGAYGNARQVPTLTINSEGQVVNATQTPLEAAGTTGQIQYNTGDQFDASSRLTFNATTNQFSVLGNVSAQFFIGNGSQLTGLPASYSNANVTAFLPTYTGALPSLTGNVTTTANVQAQFFKGDGGLLSNIAVGTNYSNANVAAFLPTYTGALPVLTGNITTTANIQAAFFKGNGSQLTGLTTAVPSGGIIMWSGSTASIPAGWFFCDGTNGTPDLRDRFVLAAGPSFGVGATGGSANAVVVTHSHGASADTASLVGDFWVGGQNNGVGGIVSLVQNGSRPGLDTSSGFQQLYRVNATHSHGISVQAAGQSGTNANMPPYYALAYIMKS